MKIFERKISETEKKDFLMVALLVIATCVVAWMPRASHADDGGGHMMYMKTQHVESQGYMPMSLGAGAESAGVDAATAAGAEAGAKAGAAAAAKAAVAKELEKAKVAAEMAKAKAAAAKEKAAAAAEKAKAMEAAEKEKAKPPLFKVVDIGKPIDLIPPSPAGSE